MKDQKVFVGAASHRWDDPFTYAIGTTQSEVDEYLKEASLDEARQRLDLAQKHCDPELVRRYDSLRRLPGCRDSGRR